jgi:hypothetical protein
MKRLLTVVACTLVLAYSVAGAQPADPDCFVGIHFENGLGAMAYNCTGGVDSFFVFAESVDDFFYAFEFRINYPPCVTFLGETYPNGVSVFNGNTAMGVQVGFKNPQNGFFPGYNQLVKVSFVCNCPGSDILFQVVPHPVSGKIQYADETADRNLYECVGLTSVINPVAIATQETTWGQIKGLYNSQN